MLGPIIEDELWDVYDKDRMPTGRTHRRGERMNPGDYHIIVHICIFNKKNEMLIQRRQPFKKGWPNMWDITVGGSALMGEDSGKAAERELSEEIGHFMDFSGLRPHFTINMKQGFDDYYLVNQEVDIANLKLQPEEVKEVKWASKEEILQMRENGQFVPYDIIEWFFMMKDRENGERSVYGNEVTIKQAGMKQLPSWMDLTEIVRDEFFGLETATSLKKHKEAVISFINQKEAICAMDDKRVVGCLLFSKEENSICYLAVHPEYRRKKIGTRMMCEMEKLLPAGTELTVTTYQKDEPLGKAALAFYKNLGFVQGNNSLWKNEEDGNLYPVQTMVRK